MFYVYHYLLAVLSAHDPLQNILVSSPRLSYRCAAEALDRGGINHHLLILVWIRFVFVW